MKEKLVEREKSETRIKEIKPEGKRPPVRISLAICLASRCAYCTSTGERTRERKREETLMIGAAGPTGWLLLACCYSNGKTSVCMLAKLVLFHYSERGEEVRKN